MTTEQPPIQLIANLVVEGEPGQVLLARYNPEPETDEPDANERWLAPRPRTRALPTPRRRSPNRTRRKSAASPSNPQPCPESSPSEAAGDGTSHSTTT